MRAWARTYTALLIPMAATALTLALSGTGSRSFVQAADPEVKPDMKIEITMKNGAYVVTGHSTPGALTAVVLRNEDNTKHGFSSALFKHVSVRKEGDAAEVSAHGVKSFHVEPGKTATLYFIKGQSAARETMQYPFWCDIHSNMKGEFLIVETTGEIGGG